MIWPDGSPRDDANDLSAPSGTHKIPTRSWTTSAPMEPGGMQVSPSIWWPGTRS